MDYKLWMLNYGFVAAFRRDVGGEIKGGFETLSVITSEAK